MSDLLDGLGLGANPEPSADTGETPAQDTAETALIQTEEGAPATELETGTTGDEPSPSSLNDSEKTEPTEEEKIQALKDYADDPTTPQWARAKIQEAIGYAGKLKGEKETLQSQYEELNTKFSSYEGKEALPPDEVERLKAANERLSEVQSFSATPETVDKFLKETNPAVYQAYQNEVTWKALYKDDGTPDLQNWQAVVDRGLGYDPNDEDAVRVEAVDVITVAEAIKNGLLTKEDIDSIAGDFETNKRERQTREREQKVKQAEEFQESQIRSQGINNVRASIAGEVKPQIIARVEQFKMMPLPNEPKPISDYKQKVLRGVDQIIAQASGEIRPLQEIQKAIDIASKARGVSPQEAMAEVMGLADNPQFKQYLASGLSELNSRVEKYLAQEALYQKWMVMGYELEQSKGQKAREVINSPNQITANLPNLSQEQLAAMSGTERNKTAAERFTERARQAQNGEARLGG